MLSTSPSSQNPQEPFDGSCPEHENCRIWSLCMVEDIMLTLVRRHEVTGLLAAYQNYALK